MSDLATLPVPLLQDIQWERATSKNGVAYETTVRPAGFKTVEVNWPVGDDSWKDPGAARTLGITGYILKKRPGFFDYILHIITEKEGVKYAFTDEEPDSYTLTCNTIGEHSVSYNSKRPTIKYVQLIS